MHETELCEQRTLLLIKYPYTGFRKGKTACPQNGIRESKRVLSPIMCIGIIIIIIVVVLLFFFFRIPFNIPLPDNAATEIPSVGRAFYDSHGVFKVVISVPNDSAPGYTKKKNPPLYVEPVRYVLVKDKYTYNIYIYIEKKA